MGFYGAFSVYGIRVSGIYGWRCMVTDKYTVSKRVAGILCLESGEVLVEGGVVSG
jgi:hypothetical protein